MAYEVFGLKSNDNQFLQALEDMKKSFTPGECGKIVAQGAMTVMVPAARDVLLKFTNDYKAVGPWGKKPTWALWRSISVVPKGGYQVLIGTPFEYGRFFEKGTGKRAGHGYIYPTTKKFLAWQGSDGTWYRAFRTSGMPPRPFLRVTLSTNAERLRQWLIQRINYLTKGYVI